MEEGGDGVVVIVVEGVDDPIEVFAFACGEVVVVFVGVDTPAIGAKDSVPLEVPPDFVLSFGL